MNPLTLEWVSKAESDLAAADVLARDSIQLHTDAICFHAQQSIEKYLKSWLQETGVPFRKTHDLVELLQLTLPLRPAWASWRQDLTAVAVHSVDTRYPGTSSSAPDAQHALQVCTHVRLAVRTELGLPL